MPLKNGLPTHQEMRALSEADLVGRIDDALDGSVSPWRMSLAQLYRDELVRREQDKTNASMLKWTLQVRNMTLVILAATIINVVVAYCAGSR